MPTPHGCIPKLQTTTRIPLRPLKINRQKRLILLRPNLLHRGGLPAAHLRLESRQHRGGKRLVQLLVRGEIGDGAEVALGGLKWADKEHVLHHRERLAETCLDHLEEGPDGCHTCYNVRFGSPCVGDRNNGPREGEEGLEGLE